MTSEQAAPPVDFLSVGGVTGGPPAREGRGVVIIEISEPSDRVTHRAQGTERVGVVRADRDRAARETYWGEETNTS